MWTELGYVCKNGHNKNLINEGQGKSGNLWCRSCSKARNERLRKSRTPEQLNRIVEKNRMVNVQYAGNKRSNWQAAYRNTLTYAVHLMTRCSRDRKTMRDALRLNPELIEAHRANLQLKRAIKNKINQTQNEQPSTEHQATH